MRGGTIRGFILYLAAWIFPVAGLRLSCADKSSRSAGSI